MLSDNIARNESGHLTFAGHDTTALAEQYGTPLYVLHVARTKDHVLGYVNEPEALEYLLRASVSHGAEMLVVRNV